MLALCSGCSRFMLGHALFFFVCPDAQIVYAIGPAILHIYICCMCGLNVWYWYLIIANNGNMNLIHLRIKNRCIFHWKMLIHMGGEVTCAEMKQASLLNNTLALECATCPQYKRKHCGVCNCFALKRGLCKLALRFLYARPGPRPAGQIRIYGHGTFARICDL